MILPRTWSAPLILIGYSGAVSFVVWSAHSHSAGLPSDVVLALTSFSFGWAFLSILQVNRGCRRLGLKRSNYTQLLSMARPTGPDELFIWQWTIQVCCAILAVVIVVLGLAFAN